MMERAKLAGILAFVALATVASAAIWAGIIWLAWDVRLRHVIAAAVVIALAVTGYKRAERRLRRSTRPAP